VPASAGQLSSRPLGDVRGSSAVTTSHPVPPRSQPSPPDSPPTGRRLALPIAVLLVPSFLANTACFCAQAIDPAQPASDVGSLILSTASSVLLSALAAISSILYWMLFRRAGLSRSSSTTLYILGVFPILLALSRILIALGTIVACFTGPECLLGLMLALGGGA
jgi:hypothetical protein